MGYWAFTVLITNTDGWTVSGQGMTEAEAMANAKSHITGVIRDIEVREIDPKTGADIRNTKQVL